MPCYDPPEDDKSRLASAKSQVDRYVACLKDIEGQCKHVAAVEPKGSPGRALALLMMDIINDHFGDRTW
jgi:hypothetical protein